MVLSAAKCPSCNLSKFRGLMEFRTGYCFGVCKVCGLNYVAPAPTDEDLKLVYGSFGQAYPNRNLIDSKNDFVAFAKDRFAFVTESIGKKNGGRLLEIGSSYGLFLSLFKDLPWEVHGIEPSVGPASFSQTELALQNVQNCMLEEADLAPDSFDIVCSFHVIEHLRNPQKMLVAARKLLKDGGRLVVATPNLMELKANIIHQFFLRHGLHLTLFTPRTMEDLLRRCGFEMVRCQQEEDRPAESGSMIIEAKKSALSLMDNSPAEYKYALGFCQQMQKMQRMLAGKFNDWAVRGLAVAVYGAGVHTRGLLECLDEEGSLISVKEIYDDDPAKAGEALCDIPVKAYRENCLGDIDVIVVSSLAAEKQILEKLERSVGDNVEIVGIYRDIVVL